MTARASGRDGGGRAPDVMSAEEYNALIAKEAAPRKYRNKIVEDDGFRFDSQAEHRRYCELKLMQAEGEISGLEVHPKIPLAINGVKLCTYIGDFRYIGAAGVCVEDVKGVRTGLYRLKRKLVLALHGIEIQEVR